MPEFETGGERTSIDDQKAIAKRMMTKIMGKEAIEEPSNGTPFTNDQLTFMAMAWRDLLPRLGYKGKKLLEQNYDPVSVITPMWQRGRRE